MCETDYPHSDSTWPNCIAAVKKVIGRLPSETQYKLLAGTPNGSIASPRPNPRCQLVLRGRADIGTAVKACPTGAPRQS